jgi:hypothetical protein
MHSACVVDDKTLLNSFEAMVESSVSDNALCLCGLCPMLLIAGVG